MKMKVLSKNTLVLGKQLTKITLTAIACSLMIASVSLAQVNDIQEGFAGPRNNGRGMNREQRFGSGGEERGLRRRDFRDESGKKGKEGSGRLERMGGYLSFIEKYFDTVEDPRKALALTAMNIKKEYKKQGKSEEAVILFEDALKTTTDVQARNILLFTLRQVYEESKDSKKVSELDKQIFNENLKAISQK
jgi:hypothetical protein